MTCLMEAVLVLIKDVVSACTGHDTSVSSNLGGQSERSNATVQHGGDVRAAREVLKGEPHVWARTRRAPDHGCHPSATDTAGTSYSRHT